MESLHHQASSSLVLKDATGLPQELTDIVIDHLHDDKASLVACSLVSRDWLWPARYHLFYSISVSTFNSNSESVHGLASFLDLLDSSALDFGTHVQHLHIRGARDSALDDPDAVLSFVRSAMSKLPSIRQVKLCGMVWAPAAIVSPLAVQTPSINLDSPLERRDLELLSLKDVRLEATDAGSLGIAQHSLFRLFCMFSDIRLLSIDTVRIGYRSLYSSPPSTPTTHVPAHPDVVGTSATTTHNTHAVDPLSTATISGRSGVSLPSCRIRALNCFTEDDSFYFLTVLASLSLSSSMTQFGSSFARDALRLEALMFGSGCPEITVSAQTLVNEFAAKSLKFVKYRVPLDRTAALRVPVFDLSQCQELQAVHLSGFLSSTAEVETVLDQMTNVVACLPTGTTRTVVLEFFANPYDLKLLYDESCQERLSRLDILLTSLPELQTVFVALRTRSNDQVQCAEKVQCGFPSLAQSGKLRAVVHQVGENIDWRKVVEV